MQEDKKEFVKLFGEYLRIENILQNYDEFTNLKAFKKIDPADAKAVEEFKQKYYVSDEDISDMKNIDVLTERAAQDYRSLYNDIREWKKNRDGGSEKPDSLVDWNEVVFEVDLLKSQEINLDYILELIFEKNKEAKDKKALIEEIRRVIRSSIGNRSKEDLVVDYINSTDLDTIADKANIIESFFQYAQLRQKEEAAELIKEENLNEKEAKRYISISLKRGYASELGTELMNILPKMSPLNPEYMAKKEKAYDKISKFVDKYKGVGGEI